MKFTIMDEAGDPKEFTVFEFGNSYRRNQKALTEWKLARRIMVGVDWAKGESYAETTTASAEAEPDTTGHQAA